MRRKILGIILLLLISCYTKNKEEVKKLPNIIVILSDDQGWGDLSLNGNQNLNTPNIDKLAKTGALLENFFVAPVCSPTRAEFLTGRYHPRGGVYSTSAGGERLDLDEITITDVFQKAGYATAGFGKWHNGMQPPYHPNNRGIEEFYGFCSGHWGDYFSPSLLEHNGKLVKGEGFIINDFTEKAMEFMQRNKENPFFVYLPYNTPHSPMQVPDRFWNKFKNKELELLHHEPGKEDIQFTKAALALCENIDWNVGRVITKLKELDLEENTIIIYFSDNGPNSWRWNGGMKGRKGSTDEGGVRVPMLIQWAGKIEAGKKIKQIAGAIDLLPTLADLAGIDYPSNNLLDGKSLKPLLLNKNPEWEDRYIFNYWNDRISVRSQNYRLDSSGKLYDMEEDRGQNHDISVQKPEITRAMLKAAETWNKDVASELPEEDKRPLLLAYPGAEFTQLPARDGLASGNIKRSNQYPNSSFFTNWKNMEDKIIWDVEVVADGDFEVLVYYTCPKSQIGSTLALSLGENRIIGKVTEAYDPPIEGMKNDRVDRMESYVKDFKPMKLGIMHLEKGTKGKLTLEALEIPGSEVIDFRLLMFKRI